MAAAATKPPLELSGWLCTTKNFKYGYEKSVLGCQVLSLERVLSENHRGRKKSRMFLFRRRSMETLCGGSSAGSQASELDVC